MTVAVGGRFSPANLGESFVEKTSKDRHSLNTPFEVNFFQVGRLSSFNMSFTSLFSSNQSKNEEIRLARRLLIKAAKEGHHTTVLRSILQGASVDSRDKHGDSVLNLASFQGHENVVNILIENGATIDKRGKGTH